MAEERNQVGAPAENTDEIKSEIERTRVEMSETLGEIQDRLRPDHLLQQARDGVTQAATGKVKDIMNTAGETASEMAYRARGAGGTIADYVRQHPLQVAMAVGALAWWMMRNRSDYDEWDGAGDTSWDDSEAISYDDGEQRSLRNRVGEYASSARDTVGDYASTARETVGEYASSVGSGARYASQRVRRAASTATTSVDDWVHTNPMAAGAVALAVGAAIGLSVPATELENRTMGETRDQAWERARQKATELKDNVSKKVESVAETFVGDNMSGTGGQAGEPMGRA